MPAGFATEVLSSLDEFGDFSKALTPVHTTTRFTRSVLVNFRRSTNRKPSKEVVAIDLDRRLRLCCQLPFGVLQGTDLVSSLSIVIAYNNLPEQLETTLVSLLENRPADCEIIVAHSGNYADPYDLTDEVRFVDLASNQRLADLLNAGVAAANSDVVHILECGIQATEGWCSEALEAFEDSEVASVSPVIFDRQRPERILATGVVYGTSGTCGVRGGGRRLRRSHARIAGPTKQAAFYRAASLRAIGGFTGDVGPDLLAVDVAVSLQQLGLRTVFEPSSILLGEAVTTPMSAISRGKYAERLFARHAASHRWLPSLLSHPWTFLVDVVRSFPSPQVAGVILGRLLAWFTMSGILKNRISSDEALEWLADEANSEQHVSLNLELSVTESSEKQTADLLPLRRAG